MLDEERLAGEVKPLARLFVRKMTSGRDIFTGKGRFHVLFPCVLPSLDLRALVTD